MVTDADRSAGRPRDAWDAAGRIYREPAGVTDKTELLSSADLGSDEPLYWPSVVRVGGLLDDPLGEYYLYYSASHADSAIRLAVADDPLGPYDDRGPIFEDVDAGPQTETPTVMWNPDAGRFHMYYHGFLGKNQSTALAFSTDGVEWEKHGLVIDAPPHTPGHDHTGYAKVHRIGGEWIAHHLMGGGAAAGYGVSYSTDGIDWTTDPRRLADSPDLTTDPERRIGWSASNFLDWGGRLWWIGGRDLKGHSGGGLWERRVVHAPAHDERSLVRNPQVLVEPTEPWEGVATYTPELLLDDGSVYVFYGTHGEGFGNIGGAVLEAEVADAPA